jgi:hypothetical protein
VKIVLIITRFFAKAVVLRSSSNAFDGIGRHCFIGTKALNDLSLPFFSIELQHVFESLMFYFHAGLERLDNLKPDLAVDSRIPPPARVEAAVSCLPPLKSEETAGSRKLQDKEGFRHWTIRDYAEAYRSGTVTPTMVHKFKHITCPIRLSVTETCQTTCWFVTFSIKEATLISNICGRRWPRDSCLRWMKRPKRLRECFCLSIMMKKKFFVKPKHPPCDTRKVSFR